MALLCSPENQKDRRTDRRTDTGQSYHSSCQLWAMHSGELNTIKENIQSKVFASINNPHK